MFISFKNPCQTMMPIKFLKKKIFIFITFQFLSMLCVPPYTCRTLFFWSDPLYQIITHSMSLVLSSSLAKGFRSASHYGESLASEDVVLFGSLGCPKLILECTFNQTRARRFRRNWVLKQTNQPTTILTCYFPV